MANEAQVWVLIGLIAVAMCGLVALTSMHFVYVVKAEFRALRGDLRNAFGHDRD